MTIVKLDYPLQHGEQQITELVFTRPKYKQVKGKKVTDLDSFNYTVELTSQLTNLPLSVFENLDYSDIFKCVKVLVDFLPSSQVVPKEDQ